MNKTKIFAIVGAVAVVLVVVLCFFCCGGKKDQYCSVIPKDAVTLMRIDVKSFVKNHDIDLSPVEGMMGKDATDAVENCGIDFSKPIYAFYLPSNAVGICAKMSDASKLKGIIETFGKSFNVKVSEKQGFTWVETSDGVAAFDNDRLLILSGAGMYARKNILLLMELKEEESVLETSMFKTISATSMPLTIIASTKALPAVARAEMAKSMSVDVADFDTDVMFGLDFQKDKALVSFDLFPNNDKIKEMLTEDNVGVKKISGSLISKGLANPFLWGALSIDGPAILAKLKGAGLDQMPELEGFDLNKLFNAVKGDATFAVDNNNMENFLVQMESNDNGLCDFLGETLNKYSEQSHVNAMKVADGQWCISSGQNPVFMGMKQGNLFYVTSSSDLSKDLGKDVETGLEAQKGDITSSYVYITIDAAQLMAAVQKEYSISPLFFGRLSHFDRLTFKVTSPTHAELSLSVKDGKDFVETVFK